MPWMERNYSHIGYLGVAAPWALLRYDPLLSLIHHSTSMQPSDRLQPEGITEQSTKQRREDSLDTGQLVLKHPAGNIAS